ncbi:hypothetical protein ACFE04_028161 [Oxalis oulophora]
MGLGTANNNNNKIKDDDDVVVVIKDSNGGEGKSFGIVSCSICLEIVADDGDRSWAKLQCGHRFHLDCIGSAFNVKGTMQCPNCRKIEKGQWLYSNASRSSHDFNMDEFAYDEDLYDLTYSEMLFGVQWCPFSSVTRLPSSFDGVNADNDLLGQHAIFTDHQAVPSSSHTCPYVAYFGPVHPSSSNSSGSVPDSSNFNNHWGGPSLPSDVPTSYGFPPMDPHYHSWENHTTSLPTSINRMGGADQPSAPLVTQRPARSSDLSRSGSYMHPFLVGHSSSARAGNSVAPSPVIPPYPGSNARTRDRVQALQAYYQPHQPTNSRSPLISGNRRSNNHRSVAQIGSSSDQPGGYYYVPNNNTSGRSFQETENPVSNQFHLRERDYLSSFASNQLDRDSGRGVFRQGGGGGSDNGVRPSSFRQRHGSDRTSSQHR